MLLQLCRSATQVLLAAPYMKVNALAKVLGQLPRQAQVTCVTRWNPLDICTGASDVGCRTLVKDFGGYFRLHPTLHAKYFRLDDRVLVGSANLTDSAMGWTRLPNLEILCHPDAGFESHTLENRLLEESREIQDSEFRLWQALEGTKERSFAVSGPNASALEYWKPGTRDPRNLELSYANQEERIASYDEQRLARSDLAALSIPPGLSTQEVRTWVSACLLSAPFPCAVVQQGASNAATIHRILAQTFQLSMRQARRDTETVQNWLRHFAPDALPSVP